MLSRIQVTALVGVVLAVNAVVLGVEGHPLKGIFSPFTYAVSCLMGLLFVFDGWLWKWTPFAEALGARRNIDGTWRAQLQTNWVNPQTMQTPGPIEAFFVIRQTFSSVSVRMFTAESESVAVVSTIEKAEDGVSNLINVYRNTPKQGVRSRSEIHHGALTLRLEGTPPTGLRGEYWTERGTKGSIVSSDHVSQHADSFEDAKHLFS